MARSDEPLIAHSSYSKWLARLVLIALAVLCLTPLVALGVLANASLRFDQAALILTDPVVLRALRFTLIQAALSTVLSIGLAIPVLMALRQIQYAWVQQTVRLLFSLPLVLPQIVAALAIVAVFGQNGWFAALTNELQVGWPSIYGLGGILLAHVFFNMPLAVRIFDQTLQSMPPEYDKMAAQLGLKGFHRFRLVEAVVIRNSVGGVASLIFLLCATSFTVVLMLGGGPRSTTLEVAIYQSLAFDFDLGRALFLILLQIAVTGMIVLTLSLGPQSELGGSNFSISDQATSRFVVVDRPRLRFDSFALLIVAFLFVGLPFGAIIIDGLLANPLQVWAKPSVLAATATSVVIGVASAFLATLFALVLAGAASTRTLAVVPTLALVFPPIVLSAGWLLTIRQFVDPFAFAPALVIVINAAMALPFVIRIIEQALKTHRVRHGPLEAQLGINGWSRWRLSVLPALKLPFLTGFAFAFALSLGDFGVVALFGSDRLQTLPYLIYSNFGSYRSQDAIALALLLTSLVFSAIGLAELFARYDRSERAAPL
ncbi:MAG: thiamine/thiamine pyrophosphate ABC transporter permease ThiP [Pseudomonadota bacterium]